LDSLFAKLLEFMQQSDSEEFSQEVSLSASGRGR